MKTSINLSLTHEEALKLAKYLPTEAMSGSYDEDPVIYEIKEQLCEILDIDSWDL